MKHTKEPWTTHSIWLPLMGDNNLCILTQGDNPIKICRLLSGNESVDIENAHRIVTCVNACEGLNAKAIPEAVEFIKSLLKHGELEGTVKHKAMEIRDKLAKL